MVSQPRGDHAAPSGAIAARPESAAGGNPQADLLIAIRAQSRLGSAITSERSEQSDSGCVGADPEQLVDSGEAITPIGQPIDQRANGCHALVSRPAARLPAIVEDQDRARAGEPVRPNRSAWRLRAGRSPEDGRRFPTPPEGP